MAVVAHDEGPRSQRFAAALLLTGAAVGLVSATAAFAFAGMLPGSLVYVGPATDIPVFSELDTAPLRRTVLTCAVITAAMALVALIGFTSLLRGAAPRLGIWLLTAFVLLTGGGGIAVAPLFVGGTDKDEVIRGGLPTWFIGTAVVLWLVHAAVCLIAAAVLATHPDRVLSHSAEDRTSRPAVAR